MGALRAASDAALRVPEDIGLVSFDDIPWGGRVDPPLTVVAQPTYDLGVSAARVLLERIREPHRPVRRVALQTTLVIRRSCGAAAEDPGALSNR
jgi:LacI family transcriptional regulator